jgi:signal transduction histidine kinase
MPEDTVTILMVDDQPAKLLSYEAMLSDLGVTLISATSGRAALEVLLKREIAVVLMDVSMPELDGFELAALIRQHPRYQQTAIIFISGVHLTDHDRLKGYALGAVDYLPVPVIPEILRAKVSLFVELYRKTRQLEDLNRDLERRVAERTAALQAALQIRDEFLAVAAHELKTPITSLRINAQLILRRLQRGEEQQSNWLGERVGVIERQADRLTRLINQVLDVARLDQRKLAIDRAPVDIVALAAGQVALMQARTAQHTITLAGEAHVLAEIDSGGIEQVISNLLDNAIKYSPDGGEILVTIQVDDRDQVSLAVRDHGVGIPADKRDAIFERFYQAHADDHRSGLGLGLYICAQIVALHDGNISVEFPNDGGTQFVVTLPIQARTSAAGTLVRRVESGAADPGGGG